MAAYFDNETSLCIGDTDETPLSNNLPSPQSVTASFSPLILSASGWRKVFAVSVDEEDFSPAIGEANEVIAAHIADVYADFLLTQGGPASKKEIVLGLDSRPTGSRIGDIMCRVFTARGFTVRYLFIAAAPEIMSYARGIGAFAYVSASHNPVGHNGVKFGLADGGVLSGSDIGPLIAALKRACADPEAAKKAQRLIASCDMHKLEQVWKNVAKEKKTALEAYATFSREVISGESDSTRQKDFFSVLARASDALRASGKPVSIIADFNGSARSCSIDRRFFEETGIALTGMSEKPGQIVHRIVPEGDSLSFCAREIERLHREGRNPEEKNMLLGYVPDCDGDRGNIVYWNSKTEKAEILEAQEVFALCVIAELSHLKYLDKEDKPIAVAINDPTSMRVESIASAFGAKVARAEVGEANVVNLARSLRERGYTVRILGEGSNGGNITHPAAVRDPLNTVFALLKMLVLRDEPSKRGLFHIWCSLSGQEEKYRADFTLADIMATLPAYVTTSVYEKDAMVDIKTADHAVLKRRFQAVFEREWKEKKDQLLARYGWASWTAICNNGTEQTENLADFGQSMRGGLKIQFFDTEKTPAAFIWMRGSGTEAVFRILADARGSDVSVERMLLAWLTSMVLEADRKIE